MARLAPAYGQPLETSDRGSTATPVFIQDQTSQPIDIWFTEDKGQAP